MRTEPEAASTLGKWIAETNQERRRLEAFRRLGVGLYLFGIAFGLGTIIHVLRFQAVRIRELAGTS